MELTVLTVPDCPNAAAFEERLAAALADYPDAVVRRRQVADEREAAETGMAGSPTLLINGADPFAAPARCQACPAASTGTQPGGPQGRPRQRTCDGRWSERRGRPARALARPPGTVVAVQPGQRLGCR